MKKTRIIYLILSMVSNTYLFADMSKNKEPNVVATTQEVIHAPIEKVWAILAEDWAGIGKWSSGVSHSQGFGEPIGGSAFSIRACEITAVGFDDTKEEILEFDMENHLIRYQLSDGLPGFVKDAINVWTLKETANGTLIKGKTTMRATGTLGWMMKGIMKRATRKALESMATELKYYVETGKLHPNKVASNEKIGKKDLKMRKKVVSIAVDHIIDVPVEKVWQVIGEGFADIADSNPECPSSEWVDGFDKAEIGAKRIMYMSNKKNKKYFIDEIVEYDPSNHKITIEVVNKKGFPLNTEYTWVNMEALSVGGQQTQLKIRFNYLTKPRILKSFAKGSMKKAFQEYAYAIDYHVETGEKVTKAKWKEVKHLYH